MSHNGHTSFSLAKFSFVTSPAISTSSSLLFHHESQGVTAVFDNHGSTAQHQQQHSVLKVHQGVKVLERVDLAEKINEADVAVEHARLKGQELRVADVPTVGLFSLSGLAIALRYLLTRNQVRKIQMKFKSDVDFELALKILRNLGCHLQNKETKVSNRPSDPAGTVLLSGRLAAATNDRPNSSYGQYRPFNSQYGHTTLANIRPSTPLYPIREDESIHSDIVLQNIGGIDSSSQQIDAVRRPSTAFSANDPGGTTPFSRPTSVASAFHLAHDGRSAPESGGSCEQSYFPKHPESSSKIVIPEIDTFDYMLPPRRELPFKRPNSKAGSSARESSSRPPSSADLPPLPIPNFIDNKTNDDAATRPRSTRPSSKASAQSRPGTTSSGSKKQLRQTLPKPTSDSSTVKGTNDRSSGHLSLQAPATAIPGQDLSTSLSKLRDTMAAVASFQSQISAKENLADYVAMPYEERMSIIEKMIIEGVSDEKFITLCEDVHGCWQRIGLGK